MSYDPRHLLNREYAAPGDLTSLGPLEKRGFPRTVIRLTTDRPTAFLLDEAQGQAVPPGNGRGLLEEIRVQDNG